MKILIMTGAFGEGHHSAAQAVSEQFCCRLPGARVQIVDIVEQLFEKQSKVIYGMFRLLVRRFCPVYNLYCRMTASRSCITVNKMIAKRIAAYLDIEKPDVVVVTVPIIAQYISDYREQNGRDFSLYTYITDIEVRHEWLAPYTDQYFVASREVKQSLMKRGVSRERITVSGIPVRSSFIPVSSELKSGSLTYQKRKYGKRKEHDTREVLVMGGGIGMIPDWKDMLEQLLSCPRIHITVIVGKNQALQKEIQRSFPMVRVIGVTNRVAWYMKQADVLVTKAGGVTMFEAIYSELPMCVIAPFLSQERDNAGFIEKHQLGVVLWEKEDHAKYILALLESPYMLTKIQRNMRCFRNSLHDGYPYELEWREEEAL